jgi:pimeloyl-ACP methyl ester carboxylesterase
MSSIPPLAGVRHEFVDVNGLRTHVALAGENDAPPLLLVHGWPQSWWVWRKVIPALAKDFRVLAPDLRGHGWTEAPASGYEKQQLTLDLLGVLDAYGIERASWAGHDWGGWTGFLAALHAPERLERLLALCIPHPWTPPHPRQLALLAYQGPVSLPIVGRLVADPMVRAILRSGRGGDPLDRDELASFADHIPPHVTVAMYRTFLTRELLPAARRGDAVLQVPTTLLVGERDPVTRGISPGHVEGQPQLRVETVEAVGHWLPEQRPDAVTGWVGQGTGATG